MKLSWIQELVNPLSSLAFPQFTATFFSFFILCKIYVYLLFISYEWFFHREYLFFPCAFRRPCCLIVFLANVLKTQYIQDTLTLVRMNEILQMMQKLTSEISQTLKLSSNLKVNRTVQMEDGTRRKEIIEK